MLARKGSDSNRSKRYIFDVIVFSAKHKIKLPYWEFFYGAAKKTRTSMSLAHNDLNVTRLPISPWPHRYLTHQDLSHIQK